MVFEIRACCSTFRKYKRNYTIQMQKDANGKARK